MSFDDPGLQPQPDSPPPPRSTITPRIVALLEILICSDFPTQVAIGATLQVFGISQNDAHGRLSVAFVVALSLADAIALIGLILIFLRAHGEHPRDVLFGRRRLLREVGVGVPMILVALGIAIAVLLSIQKLAPSLHTVENNPLQDLLRSPRDAILFSLVVLVAGGVREEVQRAFLIHRFDVWLGGSVVGVVATSAAFGLGHLIQGVDAALATALMGAFWGAVYVRRRSCVAPMVSHAGFDLLQVTQFFVVGR